MTRSLASLVAIACLLAPTPAYALDFGSSTTTNKGVTSIPLEIRTPDNIPVGGSFGIRWMPGLSDALGPARINPSWGEPLSMLIDANANLRGNIPLMRLSLGPLGVVQPIVSPFIGYRYLGIPTAEAQDPTQAAASGNLAAAAASGAAFSYSQFSGVNYGVGGELGLPLGFEAHTSLGLTTLVSGGWDTRQVNASNILGGITGKVTAAGRTDPQGATLPDFVIGTSWSGLGILNISLGYEVFALPTLIRSESAKLDSARTIINNLTIGISIFSFGI